MWQDESPIGHCFLFGNPRARKCVKTVADINHGPGKTCRALSMSLCVRYTNANCIHTHAHMYSHTHKKVLTTKIIHGSFVIQV